jgi:hypothetical protein
MEQIGESNDILTEQANVGDKQPTLKGLHLAQVALEATRGRLDKKPDTPGDPVYSD